MTTRCGEIAAQATFSTRGWFKGMQIIIWLVDVIQCCDSLSLPLEQE